MYFSHERSSAVTEDRFLRSYINCQFVQFKKYDIALNGWQFKQTVRTTKTHVWCDQSLKNFSKSFKYFQRTFKNCNKNYVLVPPATYIMFNYPVSRVGSSQNLYNQCSLLFTNRFGYRPQFQSLLLFSFVSLV